MKTGENVLPCPLKLLNTIFWYFPRIPHPVVIEVFGGLVVVICP